MLGFASNGKDDFSPIYDDNERLFNSSLNDRDPAAYVSPSAQNDFKASDQETPKCSIVR